MDNRNNNDRLAAFAALAVGGIGLGLLAGKLISSLNNKEEEEVPEARSSRDHDDKVAIIDNSTSGEEYWKVISRLYDDMDQYPVLGFDCEWVSDGGTRRPVALLQLSSASGFCALVRLCELKRVPAELKKILECSYILKVGVGPFDDAQNLRSDYEVNTKSIVDLRHLAEWLDRPGESLAKMANTFLGVQMNKDLHIRISAWDSPTALTRDQIDYAAKDVQIALDIFKDMRDFFSNQDQLDKVAFAYVDEPFVYPGKRAKPTVLGRRPMKPTGFKPQKPWNPTAPRQEAGWSW